MNTEQKNTLSFVRVAHKAKDNHDGLMYIHRWATGYQYLIFNDRAAADRWAASESTPTEVKH